MLWECRTEVHVHIKCKSVLSVRSKSQTFPCPSSEGTEGRAGTSPHTPGGLGLTASTAQHSGASGLTGHCVGRCWALEGVGGVILLLSAVRTTGFFPSLFGDCLGFSPPLSVRIDSATSSRGQKGKGEQSLGCQRLKLGLTHTFSPGTVEANGFGIWGRGGRSVAGNRGREEGPG